MAASYCHRTVDELTVNDVDLGLNALNLIRQTAEMSNDFGFTRKLVNLTIDGVTGGSLDNAVDHVTLEPVTVKTVVDVGSFDGDGNLVPAYWTTTADSLNSARAEHPYALPRYPTDTQVVSFGGMRRFTFTGDSVFTWPAAPDTTFNLGIEAYILSPDWELDDTQPAATVNGDVWLTRGAEYLQWALVVHVNQLFRDFVFRQEGNLPPPQELRDQAFNALVTWDTFKYEQFRRHDR
jgi:hypothetical protein